ncbi:MAG: hypothetical protein SVS15_07765 [Thermodesulfobacteriota bacterium]|nr:hypothetical protein [Thermodesulfobacteriota bacterium]
MNLFIAAKNKPLGPAGTILAFLAACLLFGCAVEAPLSPRMGTFHISQKIPAKAALLIPENKRDYVFKCKPPGASAMFPHHFPLGLALEQACLDAFPQIFEEVAMVRDRKAAKKYDLAVEPVIVNFRFRYSRAAGRVAIAKIRLKFTLRMDETIIWEQSVEAEGEHSLRLFNVTSEEEMGAAATAALESAVEEMALQIAVDPRVRANLARHRVTLPKPAGPKGPEADPPLAPAPARPRLFGD